MSRDLIIYILSNLVSKLSSFILLPFYLIYLSVGDFGKIESIILIVNLISPLTFLLIDSWLEKNNFILLKGVFFKITISTIFILGCCLCAFSVLTYFFFFGMENLFLFSLSVFALPFSNVLRLKLLKLRYINDLKSFLLVNVVQAIFLLTFSFLLFSSYTQYLRMFFLSQLITVFLTNLFCNYMLEKTFIYFSFKKVDFGILSKSLRFTYLLIPSNYINILITNSYRYLTALFFSTEKIGIVGLSARFSSPINMLGDSYFNYISPLVFKDTSNTNIELKQAIKLLLFGVPIFLVGYYLFIFLLTRHNILNLDIEILRILRIFLCGVYINMISKLDFFVFMKHSKTQLVFYSNLLYLFLIGLLWILILLKFVDFGLMIYIILMISCVVSVLTHLIGMNLYKLPLIVDLKLKVFIIIVVMLISWYH